MVKPEMGQASLDAVLITEELSRRASRTPDFKAENDALRLLARQLVEQPQTILKTLVTLAKDLCQAGSAGVSLLETTPSGEEFFRWVAIAGELEQFEQGTAPRRSSPCGICLERQSPQLYSYPARYFTALQEVEPPVIEGLVLPLTAANQPIGAIWIVSHDPQRQFDAEDVRVMTSLADFTAAALYNKRIEDSLRQREVDLGLVTNAVPVLISFVDAEQRYRFNNRTYEEWFGRPAAEVYGKALWEVLGEAAYQTIRPYVEQVLSGQQVTYERKVSYQDGGTRYISATYVPRIGNEKTVEGFVALVSDISQRKRAESALRQSEERLRIAQQAAKAGVWNWDILTNQVTWSKEYYQLYGLDPATNQPSYENWLASIAEVDRDRVDRVTRETLEQQTDLNVEFRILHPMRGERWITAIGQTFYDADQQPIRMTGIALDITDRKQAEEALRQSEARFQTLVKNMPGMIYRYVPDAENGDTFTYVSPGSRELFELEPETLLQDVSPFWGLIHPDDLPSLQASIAIAVEQEASWQWEGRIITPSGQLKWIQGRARMEESECSKVWDGILLDISDRKQVEAELRESEARFRQMTDAAPMLVWMSGPDKRCNYFNQSWLNFTGRAMEQELGNGWTEGVHPDDFQRCLDIYSTAFDAHRSFEMEYRLRRVDGDYRWIFDAGVPRFTSEGDFLGYIGSCIDIHDRKQAEAEREQLLVREQTAREEAERANRIKDEFLAVLSHELRSPLNPILGWAQLLKSRKLSEAKTIEALATIERNAKLQAELIGDLLDVSRILQGKLSLSMVSVDLASTIQAAMETVRLAAEAKRIDLRFAGSRGVMEWERNGVKVVGDAARLQQVVWNLLSNAVKFTPQGGRVEVRLERVDGGDRGDRVDRGDREVISSSPSPSRTSYAQIRVTDTGQGIDPEFLPYVFDTFRQADGATTRKFGGLGLGLAIARHIVELHGGVIAAASPGEGQGATFVVRLPLFQRTEEREQRIEGAALSPQSSALRTRLKGLRILVVDDEVDTRDFFAFVLEQAGAVVTAVSSSEEALNALVQAKPDVLLSDIGMPEMDGYMLLRQVRTLPPEQGGQIPAIALTAYAGEVDYQQAMAAGFQRHLAKPIEPEELVQAITKLVGRNQTG